MSTQSSTVLLLVQKSSTFYRGKQVPEVEQQQLGKPLKAALIDPQKLTELIFSQHRSLSLALTWRK